MSTILKALRRLEEEKAAAEEPRPLREQIASAPLVGERPRRRGWVGGAVALVLGVAAGGGLIWWLFAGSSEPVQVATTMPEPVPAPAPHPAPAVQPAPIPAPAPAAGPPEQAFESDVQMVDRPDALPRLADSEPIEPARAEPVPGSTRPVESSTAMQRARHAARAEQAAAERARLGLPPEMAAPVPGSTDPAAQPAPTAQRQPRIVAVAPDILMPAAAVPRPAPKPAAEPAPEAKPAAPPEPKRVREAAAPRAAAPDDIPPFAIEKTQWHPLADRRVAWLRMPGESEPRRVVEGDVVDGLLVAKIEPSGVVFERDGKKIERVLGKR